MIEHEEGKIVTEDNIDRDGELLSDCCGGTPASEPIETDGEELVLAICSECRDWADFYYEAYYDKTE